MPTLPGKANDPGEVPCFSVDGLSPSGGNVYERSNLTSVSLLQMATVMTMRGGANGRRTIRFPTPALPERGSKGLLSAAAQSHGTPSELAQSLGYDGDAGKGDCVEDFR